MILYRLSKDVFAKDLTGKGAEQFGGRWNFAGFPMIYTSENRALCTAEIAVHTPLGMLPQQYVLISIEIPNTIDVFSIHTEALPKGWRDIPPSEASKKIGNKFLEECKFLLMKVPSVIVQGEFNYLINPKHKDISKVKIKKIEPFSFDERLFNK